MDDQGGPDRPGWSVASLLNRITEQPTTPEPALRLSEALALEWAMHGIRVNSIAPGYVVTDLNRDFLLSAAGEAMATTGCPGAKLGSVAAVAASRNRRMKVSPRKQRCGPRAKVPQARVAGKRVRFRESCGYPRPAPRR